MTTKSILLAVADPQVLVDINQALGPAWEATSVATDTDALAQLEERSFDALLADFNLGETDASDLLNLALEKRPETTRFLLAYEADLALVAAKVEGSPQILPKPVEPASLKARLDNAVKDSEPQPTEVTPVNTPTETSAIPAVYSEVLKALELPDVTYEQVGEIISRDEALTSEVLKLTNSSYLGLPHITDPAEAVHSLGLDAVKAVVMALQFLAEHSRLNPLYLSIDQLWQHSVNVAQIARDLVLFETKDRALASQALTAGLLHDLGKVVLVTNFDDLYGRVNSLARKQPVALWDVEKEMFGANHGEIGACLVGMWNMPAPVVEAAALHHEPPLGETQRLTPLAAVHIANVLERELQPRDDDMMVAPIINTPFLNELGLLQRLPVWRAAFANHLSVELGPEASAPEETVEERPASQTRIPVGELTETEAVWDETDLAESAVPSDAQTSGTANALPASAAAATRTTTSGYDEAPATRSSLYRSTWVYGVLAVAVLALAGLWLKTQIDLDQNEPVYARMPATTHEAQAVVPSTPAPAPAPALAPQATPAVAAVTPPAPVAEEPAAPPAPAPTVTKPAAPAPAPSATVTKPASPVPAPSPAVTRAVTPNPTVAAAPAAISPTPPPAPAATTATPSPAPPPTVATPPAAAPPQSAMPDFRVTGIIYSARPSAIINGEMVNVGDRVEGATVVSIGRTSVTMQLNRHRKTYDLR